MTSSTVRHGRTGLALVDFLFALGVLALVAALLLPPLQRQHLRRGAADSSMDAGSEEKAAAGRVSDRE